MIFRQPSIIYVIAMVLLTGCLERYYPDEMYLRPGVLVINAHITDHPGIQTIEISRSSNIEAPGLIPETDCYIILLREDGESREFGSNERPGFYTSTLDTAFLRKGMLFQIQVVAPNGNEYHSVFDKIRPVPAMDSLYYKVESISLPGEDNPIQGIRFYTDFTYDEKAYEFIRWELTETYEFHNPKMEAYLYYNRWNVYPLPDEDSPRVCFITHLLPTVHSMSTKQLGFGPISKSFDFVPNDKIEQKLLHKYSLLVRQYSTGPEGFHYWNELGKNHQGQGTLFDSQPALIKSNICNIADENEKVLGFFTMSGVQEIRAIAEDIPGLDSSPYLYYCLPVDRGRGSNRPTTFPAYFARATYDGTSVYAEVNKHCVDCRDYKNSTDQKPDFW